MLAELPGLSPPASTVPLPLRPFRFAGGPAGNVSQLSAAFCGLKKEKQNEF
jgi:hypothetical protein